MKIELSLTIEQVNSILAALGHRPYIDVADLINRIKIDAETQLSPKPPDPDED
jgi:hypothetical protein